MMWEKGLARLYEADARELPLADASVHCTVTSPPYWGLRDYGLTGGIGLEATLSEWLANMVAVGREVHRVLRDDGTWWLNLGDAYAGSWGNYGAREGHQRTQTAERLQRPAYEDSRHGWDGKPPTVGGSNLGIKNLIGQPWRVAFALQDDGWVLRSAPVWHKPNPMPESVGDRPSSAYEMVFMLTKSNTPQFWTHPRHPGTRQEPGPDYRWTDAADDTQYDHEPPDWSDEWIACPDCGGTGEVVWESGQVSLFDGIPSLVSDCARCTGEDDERVGQVKRWKRINLWRSHDYFYDAEAVRQPSTSGPSDIRKMLENKDRIGGKHTTLDDPRVSGSTTSNAGRKRAVGDPSGASLRNVWTMPTKPYSGAHFATFPSALPRRCIRASTSELGVCRECGAPWVRVVETQYRQHEHWFGSKQDARHSRGNAGNGYNEPVDRRTVDWQPTCACDAETGPATVLDPFVGSGTTVAVAQQLGRRGVGIDLNPAYLELAKKRITG